MTTFPTAVQTPLPPGAMLMLSALAPVHLNHAIRLNCHDAAGDVYLELCAEVSMQYCLSCESCCIMPCEDTFVSCMLAVFSSPNEGHPLQAGDESIVAEPVPQHEVHVAGLVHEDARLLEVPCSEVHAFGVVVHGFGAVSSVVDEIILAEAVVDEIISAEAPKAVSCEAVVTEMISAEAPCSADSAYCFGILTDYCDRRDLLSSCGCVCCAACLSFNRRLFQDLDDRSCGCSEEIKSDFCFDICIRIGSGFLKLPAVVIPQASEFLANACAGLLPVLAESMCVARKLNASRDERTSKDLEFVGVVAGGFLNLCEGISHS